MRTHLNADAANSASHSASCARLSCARIASLTTLAAASTDSIAVRVARASSRYRHDDEAEDAAADDEREEAVRRWGGGAEEDGEGADDGGADSDEQTAHTHGCFGDSPGC